VVVNFFAFVEHEEKLISLYLCISENKAIKKYLVALRQSNNFSPEFTDQEAMTIYLYGIMYKFVTVKDIHRYTRQHLRSWFPKLPSYQAFNNRLNFIWQAFGLLSEKLMQEGEKHLDCTLESVLDSMPIVVAGRIRSGTARVAPDVCNKGYCASKRLYYYGLKLHMNGLVNPGTIPVPEVCWFSSAEENDLTNARPMLERFYNRRIYADKIYRDAPLNEQLMKEQNTILLTPVKKKIGQLYLDAADQLFSTAVSRIRQPVESFFNWLNEKTQIQNATKVRSENGLWVHAWGRFAAALCILILKLNP
jgi:hypothetical protein